MPPAYVGAVLLDKAIGVCLLFLIHFELHLQSWVAALESVWPAKPKSPRYPDSIEETHWFLTKGIMKPKSTEEELSCWD